MSESVFDKLSYRKMENIEKDGACRISDAANTYNWALTIVKSKGYKIFLYPDERDEYCGNFWAIKGKRSFRGADPLRLLGVIALWETLGDHWQTQEKLLCEYLYDEVLERAFPDSIADIEKLTDKEFAAVVADYRIFFDSFGKIDKIPLDITKQEFFNVINNFYKDDDD